MDLDLYKYLINNLNIPTTLIRNKQMIKLFTSAQIKLPIGGFMRVKPLNKKNNRKKK